jgi:aminoglycoside phosphotransferase (APT) family kinase protein
MLAPQLPLAIPVPVARGEPGEGYPFIWSVQTWLDGQSADTTPVTDLTAAATALARFVRALRAIDPAGGRTYGDGNYWRGCPLAWRDSETRACIAQLDGRIDTTAATTAWEQALATPEWTGPGLWIHGDLMPGNLLFADGRLTAVIDFGGLGVGDPACDLQTAWNLFDADARATYRGALEVDDDAWARGRGWALSVALLQLPYYWDSNPGMARVARTTIDAVLADCNEG